MDKHASYIRKIADTVMDYEYRNGTRIHARLDTHDGHDFLELALRNADGSTKTPLTTLLLDKVGAMSPYIAGKVKQTRMIKGIRDKAYGQIDHVMNEIPHADRIKIPHSIMDKLHSQASAADAFHKTLAADLRASVGLENTVKRVFHGSRSGLKQP